jgi:hypothetical protein
MRGRYAHACVRMRDDLKARAPARRDGFLRERAAIGPAHPSRCSPNSSPRTAKRPADSSQRHDESPGATPGPGADADYLIPPPGIRGPRGRRRGSVCFPQAGQKKRANRKELAVLLIIAVLLLALILFGAGFAVHVLWWIALIVLALWLLGFLFRTAGGAGSRRRWYRW